MSLIITKLVKLSDELDTGELGKYLLYKGFQLVLELCDEKIKLRMHFTHSILTSNEIQNS